MRLLYALGLGYLGASLFLEFGRWAQPLAELPAHAVVQPAGSDAQGWFRQQKAYCHALEVETRLRAYPAPRGTEGAGFEAACYALARRIDRARAVIEALPAGQRAGAAHNVFAVGRPVVDAGEWRWSSQRAGACTRRCAERGALGADAVAALGWQLADALAAAHRAGVLHRDVKPQNVLIAEPGRYLLADFGSARVEGERTLIALETAVGMRDERAGGSAPSAGLAAPALAPLAAAPEPAT